MDELFDRILNVLDDAEDSLSEHDYLEFVERIQNHLEKINPDY